MSMRTDELAVLPGVLSAQCNKALGVLTTAQQHFRGVGIGIDSAHVTRLRDVVESIRARSEWLRPPNTARITITAAEQIYADADRLGGLSFGLLPTSIRDMSDVRVSREWRVVEGQLRYAAWHLVCIAAVHEVEATAPAPETFDRELLDLAARVAEVCRRKATVPPPATFAEIAATERLLGFRLPRALRCLYGVVANGGFGPGIGGVVGAVRGRRSNDPTYGGFRTEDGEWKWTTSSWDEVDIADAYRQRLKWSGRRDPAEVFGEEVQPSDPNWFEPFDDVWPHGVLMLTEHGCGHWSYVDAASGRVLFAGPDLADLFPGRPLEGVPLGEFLQEEAGSIEEWLEAWLRGDSNRFGY